MQAVRSIEEQSFWEEQDNRPLWDLLQIQSRSRELLKAGVGRHQSMEDRRAYIAEASTGNAT
jgi:hypothetical protein